MIDIGIIGCGKMANAHVQELMRIPNVRIAAVCDVDEVKSGALAEMTGAKAYTSYEKMTEQEKLQLVMICLPPAFHGECARFCASKGVNVFIEKPMGIDSADCKAMIAACRDNGVMLWVGHMQRYSKENRIAKELVDSGAYGKLVAISEVRCCQYPRATSPKWIMNRSIAGGGMMYNLGAHTLDMAQYLGGSRIALAECSANFTESGSENMASGFLKLENGVAVTFNLIGSCDVKRYEIVLYLTEGEIRISPWKGVDACGKDGVFKKIADTEASYHDSSEETWQYIQLCDVIAALDGGDVKVTGEYGLEIIECMERLYSSAGRE